MTMGYKGQGKDFREHCKNIKKIALQLYGIGYIFATPRVKVLIICSIEDLIESINNYEIKS